MGAGRSLGEVNTIRFEAGRRTLSGLWMEPEDPVAVAILAHGAGAGMDRPFMVGAAAGLVEGGVSTLRFNFPFKEEGRRSPDSASTLLEAWDYALDEGVRLAGGLPVVVAGKSLGGRIASLQVARHAMDSPARAIVFFGYPLHAPGLSESLRDGHLPAIREPMLFIQGTEDALATYSLVVDLVERLGPRARLHTVEGADHSFRVRGHRRPDEEVGAELGTVAAAFIRESAG